MRKKILIAFMMLSAALATGEAKMGISKGRYSLAIPVGWIAQNTEGVQEFILYSPLEPDDTFQENGVLTTEVLGVDMSVEQYMLSARDQLAAVMTDFELVIREGNYHIYRATLGNTPLEQIQYVHISKGTAFVLTFSSDVDNFDRYLPVFERIADSFKIK